MSIFRIPEIIILIGPYLSTEDLFRFCLVNKTWNASFTPYLWRSLPSERVVTHSYYPRIQLAEAWKRFLPLVEADILYEQRHPFPGEEGDGDNSSRNMNKNRNNDNNISNSSGNNELSLPALSRNGRWIRTLVVYQPSLLRPYQPVRHQVTSLPPLDPSTTTTSTVDTTQVLRHRHHHNHNPQFATPELLLHLFKRCPNVRSFNLHGNDKSAAGYFFWKKIMTIGFPGSVQELEIKLDSCVFMAESTILPLMFRQCSPGLQRLSILMDDRNSRRQYRGADVDTRQDDVGDKPLLALKDLNMRSSGGSYYPSSTVRFLHRCVNLEALAVTILQPMWIPAMKACDQLRRLKIDQIAEEQLSLLAKALVNSLPSLDALYLGRDSNFSWSPQPVELALASVLSAGRAGWRSLNLPICGKASADALVKHCSTLEELQLQRMDGVTGQHLYQILSTSPWLVKFDVEVVQGTLARISAEDFIDLDPFTDAPTPWPCESSLRVFRARIGGVSRPACAPSPRAPQARSMVQEQDRQNKIYARLARFTHLERLELGAQGVWNTDYDNNNTSPYQEVKDNRGYHLDCLSMTLDSGLRILEGLKKMREVNVASMATKIGVREVHWMTKSWPRLEAVKGLKNYDSSMSEDKAARWLSGNHPHIRQEASRDLNTWREIGGGGNGGF
ncbi:hypothetical protein KI688_010655 [Linnemannia hyalina]|uniref:F-box domain-containing protein n=1 Tax=Linnemannia hyalina TaxID=64524 RepID=A0A9P7XWG9_9FUNG|nr:hypothetical protein KI688_010655 [Linnemannia hyalina]